MLFSFRFHTYEDEACTFGAVETRTVASELQACGLWWRCACLFIMKTEKLNIVAYYLGDTFSLKTILVLLQF